METHFTAPDRKLCTKQLLKQKGVQMTAPTIERLVSAKKLIDKGTVVLLPSHTYKCSWEDKNAPHHFKCSCGANEINASELVNEIRFALAFTAKAMQRPSNDALLNVGTIDNYDVESPSPDFDHCEWFKTIIDQIAKEVDN